MSFNLTPKQPETGNTLDWDAINDAVEEGLNPARISIIVDLGVQKRGKGVFFGQKDQVTTVDTEEEANDLLDEAEDILGQYIFEKEGLDSIEELSDGTYQVPFVINEKKDAQEIAIFADLVDTYVEYVEGEGEKQYRTMLNTQFKGEIKGLPLTTMPPAKKGGVWTFAPNSKLTKLAKATGHKEILQEGKNLNNIGLILGEPFTLNMEKTESGDRVFVNPKDITPVMKGLEVSELDNPAVGITFEEATAELLEAAKLRKNVVAKIKQAVNYEGSNMQKAIEEWEAQKAESNGETDSDNGSDEGEEETTPKRKRRQKVSESKSEDKPKSKRRGRPAKKKEPEPEVEDADSDDDLPF